jgi:Ca2+-transporting ATPase
MAVATLWVRDAFEGWTDALVATTMAVTVFSLMNVAIGLSARSETRTIFSRDLVSDRRQLTLYGGTLVAIVLATELSVLQRILDTTSLTGGQWLVCLLLAAGLVVVEELIKLVLRRRERTTHGEAP